MSDHEREPGPGIRAGAGAPGERNGERWDAEAVRRLRERLGVTQAELADRIGTRQQTISEWETGASSPRRMSGRLLRMVAEEAGLYDAAQSERDVGERDAVEGDAGGRTGEAT